MNNLIKYLSDLIDKPNIVLYSIFIFLVSFVICNKMIPLIIHTVNYKKLMDHPNERSSHIKITPTLAGIAFFASLIISLFFIQKYDESGKSLNLIAAITILFFLGLKDDLMVLSSKTKVLMQSLAIFFIILSPDILLSNFHGFIGISDIPIWIGLPISYFLILYIINAYNLIDGIDGLAGLLGILITTIYAFLFFFVGEYFYALLSISAIGFLVAFLRYNLSKKRRIFMGDTGSMIMGFLIGLLTMRFLSFNMIDLQAVSVKPENLFIVTLSILFFPVVDVIRVIIIRLLNGRGAFTADRCHLHHIFIDKGLSHIRASITLTISGLILFSIVFLANDYLNFIGLLVLFIILTFITYYLLLLLDKDENARKHRKKIKAFIPDLIYLQEFRIRKKIIIFLKRLFFKDLV